MLRRRTGGDVSNVVLHDFLPAERNSRIEKIADDLASRFPEDTVVQFNYLPTIRAQLALSRKNASKAIEALQAAAPYELGSPGAGAFPAALYPIYVRGEAYLAMNRGGEAAGEFQRILGHDSSFFEAVQHDQAAD